MTKVLEAIVLHAMTNREALMEELDDMTDEAFNEFLNGHPIADQKLEAICCAECKSRHDGKCPRHDDDDGRCSDYFNRIEWLSQPCTRERLLPEVTA